MTKLMLIDAMHDGETRVVISDDQRIHDFDFETASKQQIKGNIYLAKVTRVEPSLQAAFVEYGGGKQGFLPFSEIHPDYYQIPVADRQRLLEEEAAEIDDEDEEEDEAPKKRGRRRKKHEEEDTGEDKPHRRRRRRKVSTEEEAQGVNDTSSDEEDVVESTSDAAVEASANDKASTEEETLAKTAEEIEAETAEQEDKPRRRRGRRRKVSKMAAEDVSVSSSEVDEDGEPEAADTDDDDDDDLEEEVVETVSEDEGDEGRGRRKATYSRRYKIQEVIKRNQIMLVQATKEERGNKGASMTTFMSLAGRYCVLMPNSPKGGGISRKIAGREDRKRLKDVAKEMKEKHGMNAIIRTNGVDRTKAEIKRDYEYLIKMWSQIRETTMQSTAPELIYEESDVVKRSIRDLYTPEIENIYVEGDETYKQAKAFMKMLMPSHAAKVKKYKGDIPIFYEYDVEEQLNTMFDPEVRLPSGGSIVLHPTEALISIDVNSGRSISERNVEETAIKTNLEAAAEIARQLRLRDLAGLIVVDFIDMFYSRNRRQVERAMKDALKSDRAKIQVARISSFGLMEMSRQRLRPSISETSGIICPHCKGTGVIRSHDTVAIQAIRIIGKEALSGDFHTFKLHTHPDTALYILNNKRQMLTDMEEKFGVTIMVVADPDMVSGGYKLMKVKEDGNEVVHVSHDNDNRKRSRRGGRGRSRRQDNDNDNRKERSAKKKDDAPKAESEDGAPEESKDDDTLKEKNRGRRGGRGRRAKRDDTPAESQETDSPEAAAGTVKESALAESDSNSKADDAATDAKENAKPLRKRGSRGGRGRRTRSTTAKKDAPSGDDDEGGASAQALEAKAVTVSTEAEPETEKEPTSKKSWWKRVVGE